MQPILLVPVLFASVAGTAPVLSPREMSPFLRVISASLGSGSAGRVACRDIDVAMQLKQDGLSPDAKAPLAYAANDGQIRDYLAEGKLVVCGSELGLREGAVIALHKVAGKPTMTVNLKNASAAGITLSDALLKIAQVQR